MIGPMRPTISSPPTDPHSHRERRSARFAFLALLALWSCDGGAGSGPETPTALTVRSGDGQTADARTTVPNPPTVQVTGESGAGVGDVTVSFTVTGGGGSVVSATAVTGSDGVASSGAWTLGDPGPQQLRASVSGLDPAIFTATARDVPAALAVHAGDGQRATAGTAVADPIQVRVNGVTGAGLEGVMVSFQVTAGGGSVESATAATDGGGLASPGAWTLGAPGPQELRAAVTGLDPVTIRATALGVPAEMTVVAGAGQEVTVGTAVPVPPEVLITDSAGTPLPDVAVTFLAGEAPRSRVRRPSPTPSAAPRSGMDVGKPPAYRLKGRRRRRLGPGQSVLIDTRCTPGPASDILIVEGDNQESEAKLPVPVSPKIQVRDAHANGIEGLSVSFRGGGGSVAIPSEAETDAGGFAVVDRWILGIDDGVNYRLAARVTDGERTVGTVTFTAAATPSVYDIVIVHTDSSALSEGQLAAFAKAEEFWEKAIRGNLGWSTARKPDIEQWCLARVDIDYEVPGDRVVDDLLIYAEAREVDGPGGIFAGAGPCLIRLEGSLPVVGVMYFDIEDLDEMEQVDEGRHLDGTILHEMAHVIGFGSLWEHLGLLVDPVDPDNSTGNEDPHFVGDSAIKAFLDIGGDEYTGEPVPAEDMGGRGVVNGHWREFVFRTELMSPFINGGVLNPLSVVTLASFQDLGYEDVDLGVADEFELPPSSPELAADPVHRIRLRDDILRIPLAVVNREGRVIRYVVPGDR